MSEDKHSPEFYGEDYLKRQFGGSGAAHRWENNGVYYENARFVARFLQQWGGDSALAVGCCRGWQVHHMRNLGLRADGCEYGKAGVEHSVCGAKWCDLTDRLPYEDASYDLVECVGVLSQFPERFALHALKELHRVSKRWLWTNILVHERPEQWYHKNVKTSSWWYQQFAKAGWSTVNVTQLMAEHGMALPQTLQWMHVWEKTMPYTSEAAKIRDKVLHYVQGHGLDLGCGAEKIHSLAVGVNLPRPGEVADLHLDINAPLPMSNNKWNWVFSSHCLEHLHTPPETVLADWWRVIRPQGHLVLYLPHKEMYLEPNPEHIRMWITEEILALVKALPHASIVLAETEDVRQDPERYSFLIVARKESAT